MACKFTIYNNQPMTTTNSGEWTNCLYGSFIKKPRNSYRFELVKWWLVCVVKFDHQMDNGFFYVWTMILCVCVCSRQSQIINHRMNELTKACHYRSFWEIVFVSFFTWANHQKWHNPSATHFDLIVPRWSSE